jgi:integrase
VPAVVAVLKHCALRIVGSSLPQSVPVQNPFRGVEKDYGKGTTRPATRDEAYALHAALVAAGELHLAAVPLICFEWHQRPENVLQGHLAWTDYRPADRPDTVRIQHHKTGELVWLPLADSEGPLFPELTGYLDSLDRLGVPIVLMTPKGKHNKQARPFKLRDARARIREAAITANLAADLTLAACRHGGLTELGNAELTEQGVMALSGHKTPQAARLYVKRTETQRATAARRRRAWVESNKPGEKATLKSPS